MRGGPGRLVILLAIGFVVLASTEIRGDVCAPPVTVRQKVLLDGAWKFRAGTPDGESPRLDDRHWETITVPHTWNRREDLWRPEGDLVRHTNAWYRTRFYLSPEDAGRRIYLRFEGVSVVADVYVNGVHLGQHRGAYTRFVFDATRAVRFEGENLLAVKVDNDPASTVDCLPSGLGKQLYETYGGIYRKVWLVKTHAHHISPLDYASSGVYITPVGVSADEARLSIRTLLRFNPNLGGERPVTVRHHICDAEGRERLMLEGEVAPLTSNPRELLAQGASGTEAVAAGTLRPPRLWSPDDPHLYTVHTELWVDGTRTDVVTERAGFRFFELNDRQFLLNGVPTPLRGVNKHQETERELIAVSDESVVHDFRLLKDLGVNIVRLAHYPHAELEHRLADELGIIVYAENGNSNQGMATPTGETITREMVRQSYNHPSIVFWATGNEGNLVAADRYATIVRQEDATRLITYADGGDWTGTGSFDFISRNRYHGWYGGSVWDFEPWVDDHPYVSETGGSSDPGVHMEYGDVERGLVRPHVYEPEEYHQYLAESRFQVAFRTKADRLPLFIWWVFRDFNLRIHYKKTNTKGLFTLGDGKRDVYSLYRSFLRPDDPVVHIASKKYFVRRGSPTNGIKVYSNRPELTLTVNGASWGTKRNGEYRNDGHVVDNVFFWTDPLHQGANRIVASDGAGHEDRSVIVFDGEGGRPPAPVGLVRDVTSSSAENPAHYVDQSIQPQWPFYYGGSSNTFDEIPEAARGAGWIATRRLSDPKNRTEIAFSLDPEKGGVEIYVMCTDDGSTPAFLAGAGFTDTGVTGRWRDDRRTLVPYRLYCRRAAGSERIRLGETGLDYVILVKRLETSDD